MRKFLSLILCAVVGASCLSLVGCNKRRIADNDQTLEIYIGNFGYGYEWLNNVIAEFKQEDWVKTKYPNLDIPTPSFNSEREFPANQVLSGETTVDLLFGAATIFPNIEKVYKNGQGFFESLDDLYEMNVPGENVKFKDKMDDKFVTMNTFTHTDGSTGFYTVPWVSGMMGLLYNKTMFENNNIAVPLTTNQLRDETCAALKAAGKTPFVFSSPTAYWSCTMFLVWWAQYEGLENYSNFYQALVPNEDGDLERSVDVVKQTGRLESLKVLESLISSQNGSDNVHGSVNTLQFTQAQAKFLVGEGAMMPNGDWFENEMRGAAASVSDTFTFMPSPVISAIVDKCTTVKTDAALQAVIRAVDAAPTVEATGDMTVGTMTVSAADYNRIREARLTLLPLGNHIAYIPSYATAKGLAKDFLLYLATDKAQKAFITATHGASMPFKYDVQTEDPTLYNSLAQIQKDRLTMSQTGKYMMNENTYKMAYFGKMYRLSFNGNLDAMMTVKNAAEHKTAQQIYDADIAYWTPARWESALINAGYKKG